MTACQYGSRAELAMTEVRQAFSIETSRGSPESSGTCIDSSLWQAAQFALPE